MLLFTGYRRFHWIFPLNGVKRQYKLKIIVMTANTHYIKWLSNRKGVLVFFNLDSSQNLKDHDFTILAQRQMKPWLLYFKRLSLLASVINMRCYVCLHFTFQLLQLHYCSLVYMLTIKHLRGIINVFGCFDDDYIFC